MPKTKYWMTDGYGAKALIEGADQRDRWVPLGWSETGEPVAGERVWMRHPDIAVPALFAAEAVHLWQQKGWEPAAPPEPVSPFNADQPADVVEPVAVAAPTASPAPAGKASSDSSKEK